MSRKVLAVIVALVLSALVLGSILLLRRFDPHRLGELVLERMRQQTGAQISAEDFQLRPFQGLVVSRAVIVREDDHRSVRMSVERLILDHHPVALLRGILAVDRVRVVEPRLEVREWFAPSAPGVGASHPSHAPDDSSPEVEVEVEPEPAAPHSRLEVNIRRIEVEGGAITLATTKDGSPATSSVDRLTLHLRDLTWSPDGTDALQAFAAAGDLEAGTVVVDDLMLTAVRARLAARGGVLVLENIRASTPSGALQGRTELDLRSTPFRYSVAVQAPELGLATMIGAAGTSGLGTASISLAASGAGSDPVDALGNGHLEVADGRLPVAPVLVAIDTLVGKPLLVSAPYTFAPLKFRIEEGAVRLAGLALSTELARVGASGTVGFDSQLGLEVTLATPRRGLEIDGIGGHLLDLLTDDDGWVNLPLEISGTAEDPRVRLDREALEARARSDAARTLERLLGDRLERLLGGQTEQ